MKRLFLLVIRAYQRFVSPALPRRCRYEPTCSAYAAQAVRELGPCRGAIVAAWRLARCNPFSNGGLDPLEDRRLFRSSSRDGGQTPSKTVASLRIASLSGPAPRPQSGAKP